MSKTSIKTLSTRMLLHRTKLSKKVSKSKPFGFCCSQDRFDPLSRYNQQRPPYESSLMAITSVHECPVSKMQVKFLTSRLTREKKRLKGSEVGNQQRLKKRKLNHSRFDKSDRSINWYLEDEIALAKDMFWTEKQRIHNEVSIKAVSTGKKKFKEKQKTLLNLYPRWYQDFSLDQRRNLMNLENVMRADYEETKTNGTQRILIAIGVISTFFKLKPNIITELHKSCNLNSVDFLREIYKILTGNDFYREEYKKFYDCNERIILSAIAFLTLPEALKELHKRLPAMIVPELPPKPKPPVCLARQKNICPYKEELFKRSDWASYRNALQKWQKQYKLLQTIPKITLPCFKQQKFLINDGLLSEIRKQEKDLYINHFEKSDTKDLQKGSFTKFDTKDIVNSDEVTYEEKDFPKEENLKPDKSTSNIYQMLDDGKKSDFTISNPNPGIKHKIYGGVILKDGIVIYEIIGVANITPSNNDKKFSAMLKLDDRPKKIFPSGRENLSRNWQDWLQNADEDFKQVEEEADELIKSTQTIMKLAFPELVCDNCCSCRQTRKIEKLQQSKASIDNTMQNSEYVAESMSMHSPDSTVRSPINLTASQKEIKTNFIINDVTKRNGQSLYNISGEKIPSRIPDPPVPQLKNVPPCSCAIQQMINKKVSPSLSEDDIPWTKDEGLEECIGKKYRPDEACTYSCKTYPTDRSCRPFQTPKPIKKDIPRAAAPHRHWSPMNIPPDPRRKEEMERRKKDEAFKFIHRDNSEQDASYLNPSYQESEKEKLMTSHETKESHMDMEKKMSKRTAELQSPSKIEQHKDVSHTRIASEIFEEKKYLEEATNEIAQQNVSYKQIIDKIDEKIDDEMHPINNDDDEKHTDRKLNLMAIIKVELKKMATEGYIFAKLPKCYLMPQLRDWIMYRQSVTFSETDKKNLMQATVYTWQLLKKRTPKIKQPSLPMMEHQKKLTYKQAKEIKEKIQEARAIFHSKVRKARVSYAHTMWNTMEFGKFPSISFKRAFFTYMASKEADGHVYKPWLPFEVHRVDPEFGCY